MAEGGANHRNDLEIRGTVEGPFANKLLDQALAMAGRQGFGQRSGGQEVRAV